MPQTFQKAILAPLSHATVYRRGAKPPALSHTANICPDMRSDQPSWNVLMAMLTVNPSYDKREHPRNRAKAGEGMCQLLCAPKGGQSRACLCTDRAGAPPPASTHGCRLPCSGAHGLCEKEREKNTKSTHQWKMSVYLAVHTCKIILERSTKPGVVACTEAVVGDEY